MSYSAHDGSFTVGLRGLGEANTEAVQNYVVENSWDHPWLVTGIAVRNLPSSVQADRVVQVIRSRLAATGANIDACQWGGGQGLEQYMGRVYVKWKPGRPANAVTYANEVKNVFASAAENFAGTQFVFSYYDFDFSWYMVGQVMRGSRVYPTATLAPSLPSDPPVPPTNQADLGPFTDPVPWAIGGGAVGVAAIGAVVYFAVRKAKHMKRNRRRARARR